MPHGFTVEMDPIAGQSATLQQPRQQDFLEGGRFQDGEDAVEGVMGGDAVRQLQESAKESAVLAGPVRDLDEVIAAGQDTTETQHDDVFQAVFEILALPPG